MLDPRLYRTGLVAVVLAAIVFAFSLEDQPPGLSTTLAPDVFNGQNAYSAMSSLTRLAPARPPGSPGDERIADHVAVTLGKLGYAVSRTHFRARTVHGSLVLENVTGVLAGSSNSSIVIVAHRDAQGSPAMAELSGTGVLLELARVLSGETEHHTIVVASTSGSVGAAGAARLARALPGPVDAVLVLGDLAAAHPRQPYVVPWSHGRRLAPPALRDTVAGALSAQAQLGATQAGLTGQLLHLAFPITLSEQAPFLDAGLPAVLLSLSGERAPDANEPVSSGQITALGRTALQSVNALDNGPALSAPSGYLIYNGMIIPAWSLRLLVLGLIVPVAMTAVDGLARARRRGQALAPWLTCVLAGALVFVAAAALVGLVRVVGLLPDAPQGAVPPGLSRPGTAGVATMVGAGLVVIAGLALVVSRMVALARAERAAEGHPGARGRSEAEAPGAAAGLAVVLVLCLTTVAMWVIDPFAAVLLVPALHLWMWLAAGGPRLRRPLKLTLALLGAAAPAAAILYYAVALGLSPLDLLWNGTLLITGGVLGPVSVVLWSAVLGCFIAVLALALRSPGPRPAPAPVTVRGPLSYAGPGSLGGTESALRR